MEGAKNTGLQEKDVVAANTQQLMFRFEPDSGHVLLRRSLAIGASPNHGALLIIQNIS